MDGNAGMERGGNRRDERLEKRKFADGGRKQVGRMEGVWDLSELEGDWEWNDFMCWFGEGVGVEWYLVWSLGDNKILIDFRLLLRIFSENFDYIEFIWKKGLEYI